MEQQQQAQPTPPTTLASASAASPKPLSESVVLSKKLLGAGAFGAVYLGIHEETGEMIAVKKVTLGPPCDATAKQIEQLAGEIRLMKALDHPNVVKYLHAQRKDTDLYIYMEYLSGGSLASVLSKSQPLGEKVVRIYMRQVLEGLKYLHQKNIVHRDIKPDNILLTPQGTAKISDFGTSREFSDGKNLLTVTGTAWFMAPEVVKGTGHGAPADLWSVGCTIIQLLTGTVPFGKYKAVTAMFNIAMHPEKVQEAIPDNISPELRSLLRGCLMEEPHARLTAVQALAHPFFAGADNDPVPVVHSVVQPLPGKYRVPPVRNAEGDVPTPTPLNPADLAGTTKRRLPPIKNAGDRSIYKQAGNGLLANVVELKRPRVKNEIEAMEPDMDELERKVKQLRIEPQVKQSETEPQAFQIQIDRRLETPSEPPTETAEPAFPSM